VLALFLAQAPAVLGPPRLVEADGRPIDVAGHAAPLFVDFDGDGRDDLLVGQNDGTLVLFRNQGRCGKPELGGWEWVRAFGEPVRVPPG